jgi:hypothetical protein
LPVAPCRSPKANREPYQSDTFTPSILVGEHPPQYWVITRHKNVKDALGTRPFRTRQESIQVPGTSGFSEPNTLLRPHIFRTGRNFEICGPDRPLKPVFLMVQSDQSAVWTGPGLQHAVQSTWLTWTEQSSGERGLDCLQATQAPELHTNILCNISIYKASATIYHLPFANPRPLPPHPLSG